MGMRAGDLMTVEAELSVPVATVQLARFHVLEPTDKVMSEHEAYWLDLCLSPRPGNARACYRDRWAPNHFERLGDVFLVPPHQSVRTVSDGGRVQKSILCHLRPEPMRTWLGADWDWTDPQLKAGLDICNATIRALLLRLAEEARQPGFASDVLVELIVGQIGIELVRYCAAAADKPSVRGLAPWRLRMIEERLRDAKQAPTLSELAALCRLSVRQLTRGFRLSRGRSIGDYMAQGRLDQAKRLLGTDHSVKSIAYSLGFASPSSFSYAFRREVGETPRQFRHRVLRAGARPIHDSLA